MTTSSDTLPSPRAIDSPERLRAATAAVRVSLRWFGVSRSLNSEQKAEAAETFGAHNGFISASKRLLDVKHPAFRAVTSIRGRVQSFWKGLSLPFPEPGIRLIRRTDIDPFNEHMTGLRGDLGEAVEQLDQRYSELKAAAKTRLGRLFNATDYPSSLCGLFAVEWDFPSVEPPDYLRQLNPQLFEQECQRVASRFNEALQLAEQAFLDELTNLIAHLTERLTGTADGKPKVFRDSAVTNLVEFFDRFRSLNVRSNGELDELVSQAQQLIQGLQPQSLRDNHVLRQSAASELGQLQQTLDGLLVDRPRRNILRRSSPTATQEAA